MFRCCSSPCGSLVHGSCWLQSVKPSFWRSSSGRELRCRCGKPPKHSFGCRRAPVLQKCSPHSLHVLAHGGAAGPDAFHHHHDLSARGKLEYQADSEKELERFDSLPEGVLRFLPQLPLWSFAFTVLILALQLLLTVLICRLLPRVKPPCSYLLTSIRGQMVSLKMRWVNQASNLLRDASIVPVFMRMCGAPFGRGVAIAEEVVLPDTLVVGNGCFIASRNILTSATVDQGHFRVPCVTNLGHLTC